MEYIELEEFDEFLEDKNYIFLRDRLFFKDDLKRFNGNLQVFTMLYYLYYKFEKYDYLFKDMEEAIEDFKRIFDKKAYCILQMTHRVRTFSSKRGRTLHYMKNTWKWNEESVYDYVKGGLYYNYPCLMVTWNHEDIFIKRNWNLIVGIKKEDSKIVAKLYNGKVFFKINISKWIKSNSLYKGIAYFQ
ncbi:hypothetical protein [Lagierella sp.]|uniref:hypothetical protein n=1 Tax=Lagierella sp. TaxID=2849657 RepID=UPI0026207EBE|nr:hypothetical protein [Lagierella sp.]